MDEAQREWVEALAGDLMDPDRALTDRVQDQAIAALTLIALDNSAKALDEIRDELVEFRWQVKQLEERLS